MKSIILILALYSATCFAPPNCVLQSGTGTCVLDGVAPGKGCHVEQDAVCRILSPPDGSGCRHIGATAGAPTRGYYVPIDTAAAWDAWEANMPATMTNTGCCPAGPIAAGVSAATGTSAANACDNAHPTATTFSFPNSWRRSGSDLCDDGACTSCQASNWVRFGNVGGNCENQAYPVTNGVMGAPTSCGYTRCQDQPGFGTTKACCRTGVGAGCGTPVFHKGDCFWLANIACADLCLF